MYVATCAFIVEQIITPVFEERKMRRVLSAMMLVLAGGAAQAEPFVHQYDVRFAGLRVATASVQGDVSATSYNATARMEARGLVGFFSSGNFSAAVRGTRTGPAGFSPQVFEQVSSGRNASRLDITYRNGAPITAISNPERGPDERAVPTLSKQSGTVDFLTAVVALTHPGTPAEICNREFDSFTLTKRVRIDGDGVLPDTLTCRVVYRKVNPETLESRDPEAYTLELRPMADGRYEVARILGPSEFGQAVITRTN